MFRGSGNQQAIQKPEFVLKRANDLINTAMSHGAEKEKRLALEQIHAYISIKRSKNQQWNKTYEILMKRHLELSVDLKDYRTAKDGLHQYRNLCQVADPQSLEIVAVYVVELAESRASEARAKADKVAVAAAAKVSDLEQEESPESIMLSSMTEEGSRDRTDREVVVPWLKFVWETYRAILELLYKNAKLERTYHKICEKAFVFCQDYQRPLEFKRLCTMLREHLLSLQKMPSGNQFNKAMRGTWEWTSESVELQLQTRFSQLEASTSLELWNEGFKTVEDIYTVIEIGKRAPRPRIMATYYEKLMRIFWVSENHLFHAYCSYRYYCLSCESRTVPPEEMEVMASAVVLAALCIPSVADVGVNTATGDLVSSSIAEEDSSYEKHQRMAKLLDFSANPTRHSLLQDIVEKGLLEHVSPVIKSLYMSMEKKFHPLSLANNIVSAVTSIASHSELKVYAVPLQRVAVLRVLLQLSHVYTTVKIDFLKKLLAPLKDVSYLQVEKIMVDGISKKQLQLKIDHGNGCLNFAAISSSRDKNVTVENYVANLGCNLTRVSLNMHSSIDSADTLKAQAKQREEYLAKIAASIPFEHAALQERKKLIERRKEDLENLQRLREEREDEEARAALKQREEDEKERLELETIERELEKRRKLNERIEILRIQKELERYGVSKTEAELTELGVEAREMLLLEAKAGAKKDKDDESRRVSEQAKRLDHLTRALRLEGAKVIGRHYEESIKSDREAYEAKKAAVMTSKAEKHAADLLIKQRLAKMQPFRESFERTFLVEQEKKYQAHMTKVRDGKVKEMRQKLLARARRAAAEAAEEAEEAEARAAEEAERVAKEHAALREQERLEEEAQRIRQKTQEREREEEERRTRMMSAKNDFRASSNAQNAPERRPMFDRRSSSEAYVPPRGGGAAAAERADRAGFDSQDSWGRSSQQSSSWGASRKDNSFTRERRDLDGGVPRNEGTTGSWQRERLGGGSGGGGSGLDNAFAKKGGSSTFTSTKSKFDDRDRRGTSSGGSWRS